MGNGTCLSEKACYIMTCQLPMEHFNGSQGIEMNMLAQVNFSEASSSKKMDETIVAKLLPLTSSTVSHGRTSSWKQTDDCITQGILIRGFLITDILLV